MQEQFLATEGQYASEEKSKIVILPVPFDKTTSFMKGSDKGPAALIEASKQVEYYDIDTDSEVYKNGIHTAAAKNYTSSKEMLDGLYKDTLSYLKKDKFVVVIGGEHSISYAPIKAHADHFGPISVVQFDAHTDLRDSYQNNSLSHACVMARVKEIPSISSTVAIGIRSMDKSEKKYVDSARVFFAHDIHRSVNWMEEAVDLLSDMVYITFDLDAFCSSLMPSTGTPEPGGLFWHQVDQFLKLLTSRKKVIGFDVVELCPINNFTAPNFLAAKLTYKLLSYTFKQKEI